MVRVLDQNDQFPSHLLPITGSTSNHENNVQSVSTETNESSSQTFICIITDLTDASNTCKKHAINLSGSYTIEHLIREAGNFYSYDPFTFNLFWVSGLNNQMVNPEAVSWQNCRRDLIKLNKKNSRYFRNIVSKYRLGIYYINVH
jgi:hypothetical protein